MCGRRREHHERRGHARPAIAYLTRESNFDAGVVISASHNPFQDNGVKVFSGRARSSARGARGRRRAMVADASWTVPGGTEDRPVGPDGPRPTLPESHPCGHCQSRAGSGRNNRDRLCQRRDVQPRASSFAGLGIDVERLNCQPEAGTSISMRVRPIPIPSRAGSATSVTGSASRSTAMAIVRSSSITRADRRWVTRCCSCAARALKAGVAQSDAVVATVIAGGLESIALREPGGLRHRPVPGYKYVMEKCPARTVAGWRAVGPRHLRWPPLHR